MWCGSTDGNQSFLDRVLDQFDPTMEVQFAHNILSVAIYRFMADGELKGDLAIGHTVGDIREHFALPGCEDICDTLSSCI